MIDVAIVGAGPCGLAAAIAAKRAGLHAVTFDRSCLVSGIYGYPTDLVFFSTPEKLAIGGIPFVCAAEKPTRRDGLAYYRAVAAHYALELRQYEDVERIVPEAGGFTLHTRRLGGEARTERAKAVVVATGYFGRPNLLNVPGEDLPHVTHFFHEGHEAFAQDVVVVGGANSAVGAALDLHHAGARVTIVHFGPGLDSNIKPWVLPDITGRLNEGSIKSCFESRVTQIESDHVTITSPRGIERIPGRHVYLMLGFQPNTALLEQLGVPMDPETGIPQHDPATMETNIPGIFIAGVLTSGSAANKTFIENGRHHGELIAARLIHAHSHEPMADAKYPDVMEKLVSLCKRRGYIFQSSEIYGGTGSVWDYGPLGVELKKNIKDRWWNAMVRARDDIEGLDAAILMHPKVWEASGHVSGFVDPLVECRQCKKRFRADDPKIKGTPGQPDAQCPSCGTKGTLGAPRLFNLMFKTFMGPVEDTAAVVYLRPETAQGIYVNFLNVQQATRQKIPFGIAQIGKAFRNEITPGNFIFRTREFEQMEMQFFVEPGTDMTWFEYWKAERMKWHLGLGISPDRLMFHQHEKHELAHYARAAFDVQFDFGGTLGFQEIEGVHNRGDFDLTQHQQFSGKKLEYFDQPNNRRFVPYVVETSVGADRTTLAVLVNGYREEKVEGEDEGRTVLGIHASLAPIKAGIFPLVKKDGMPEMAEKLTKELRPLFPVFYDESGAIGRRYRRQDEVGTPWCITVDGDSTKDGTVTIRDRDTLKQERVAADKVGAIITERLAK